MLKNWPGLSNQNYRSWININGLGAKAVSASAFRKLILVCIFFSPETFGIFNG